MNLRYKPDAHKIVDAIGALEKADWLDDARSWWPKFLFHFTSLKNAVSILERELIYSRGYLEANNQVFINGASPQIIDQTNEKWKEYVRLYFRPRSPTQYSNEGFRSINDRKYDSHCPCPVYFLFDSKELLTRADCFFSEGSLASPGTILKSSADDFIRLPFRLIYHDSYFTSLERDTILYHRQAEVAVKDKLDLSALKYVFCRSEAEYKTMIFCLSNKKIRKWNSIIGSSHKGAFFFKNWMFVEKTDLTEDVISIAFSRIPSHCGEFNISIKVFDEDTKNLAMWSKSSSEVNKETLELKIGKGSGLTNYSIELFFDEALMYADRYVSELPF